MNWTRSRVGVGAGGCGGRNHRSGSLSIPVRRSWRAGSVAVVIAATLGLVGCARRSPAPWELNFDHLLHLTQTVAARGTSLELVRIYAEYPDYQWVSAPGEGIACVDDAARAAVLWLRHAKGKGDGAAEAHSRRLLRFLLAQQQEDGTFANFVDEQLHPNLTGRTSRPCLCWWTARAAWALAEGWQHFRLRDPAFADSLAKALRALRPAIDSLLVRQGTWVEGRAGRYPAWLVNVSSADASAVLTLALLEARDAFGAEWAERAAQALLDGIVAMQIAEPGDSLHGMILCYQDLWHAWGANQMYALLRGWRVLREEKYLNAALREARFWWGRLLVRGFVHEVNLATDGVSAYPQIAYDIRPAVFGLLELWQATGDSLWEIAAGLWASWLLGNNSDGFRMYDAATGRCYDGILEPGTLNRNSGAESTIEALLTLQAVSPYPRARTALQARWEQGGSVGTYSYRSAQLRSGRRYVLVFDDVAGLRLGSAEDKARTPVPARRFAQKGPP